MRHPDGFEPRNPLEYHLVAARQGEIAAERFVGELLHAQVFMPLQQRPGEAGLEGTCRALPLLVPLHDGTPVLVLFTAPERARGFLRGFPGYESGVLTEFSWVLRTIEGKVGISLNPGWSAGLDMAPELVQRLQGGETRPLRRTAGPS